MGNYAEVEGTIHLNEEGIAVVTDLHAAMAVVAVDNDDDRSPWALLIPEYPWLETWAKHPRSSDIPCCGYGGREPYSRLLDGATWDFECDVKETENFAVDLFILDVLPRIATDGSRIDVRPDGIRWLKGYVLKDGIFQLKPEENKHNFWGMD